MLEHPHLRRFLAKNVPLFLGILNRVILIVHYIGGGFVYEVNVLSYLFKHLVTGVHHVRYNVRGSNQYFGQR